MTVTINHPSAITGQPVSLTNCAGSPATFTVAASGTGLLYQWQVSLDNGTNWGIISASATNASYTIPAPTISQSSNQFNVIVSSLGCPGSHTSDAATLTVYELPAVASSPTNLTLCAGSPAIFYSTSTGVGLSYQWQVSTNGGTTYANILPDASNEYSSTNSNYGEYVTTVAENGNEYRVIVSGTCAPAATSAPPAVLTIHTPATASAGANQTICSIGTAALSGTVNGGATGGIWSGGTGSFLPSATALNATYHPSAADISAGSVTLTLTTTGQLTPCPAVTSQMVVTIHPVAVVSTGGNQTICSSSVTVGLGGVVSGGTTTGQWTTSGTGTFSPDATTLNATYAPSADDTTAGTVTLTLTSTSNQSTCAAQTAQVVVTVHKVAVVSAGGNQTICSSASTSGLGGTVGGGTTTGHWTTSGTGSFSPDATTLNATYAPTAADATAGTVTLTLTSTGDLSTCTAQTAQVVVTVHKAALVSTGGNQTICANQSTTGLGGTVNGGATGGTWTSSGTGTLTPDATTLNATYSPSDADKTAGTVTLTLTTTGELSPCVATSTNLVVTIHAVPAITSQPVSLTVCAGSPAIFAATATGAGLTYQWELSQDGGVTFTNVSATATNASYTNAVTVLADNGNQYKVVVGGSCTPSQTSDIAALTVHAPATASAGSNQTICAGNDTAALGGTVGGGATGGTWTSTGTGGFTPDATTLNATYSPSMDDLTGTGTVTLTLTATGQQAPCGVAAAHVVVTIHPEATVSAGGNQTICAGQNTAALGGYVDGSATNGIWTSSSRGTNGFTPNATTPNAIYTPSAADITAGTVTLTLTTTDAPAPCPQAAVQLVMTINPAAQVNAGANQTVCSSSATVTLAGSFGGGATSATWSGAGTFAPNNTAMGATYTPTAGEITAGLATVTLTTDDPAGPCGLASASMTITINPAATVAAGPDQTVCSSSPTVTLAGSHGGGATSATWSGAGTFAPNSTTMNATYTPTAGEIAAHSATVTLTTDDPAGVCAAVSASMTITINPAATASAGGNQTICAGNDTTALGGTVGGGATGGIWSGGSGTFSPNATDLNAIYLPSANDITVGAVTLTLTSTGQQSPCGALTAHVVVTINAAPVIESQPQNRTVASGVPATFCVGATGANLTYQW